MERNFANGLRNNRRRNSSGRKKSS